MNKIHKVIWNRCVMAFVVVAETARSHSAGRGTRRALGVIPQPKRAPLTAVAAGLALAFGATGAAFGQSASVPGGSVRTEMPDFPKTELNAVNVENTAYGNALRIDANPAPAPGPGNRHEIDINGGTFAINPANPRDATDLDAYAAIWVSTLAGEDVYLKNGVAVEANGDNLRGIYLDDFYTWVSSSDTSVAVNGQDGVGVWAHGTISVRGGDVTVTGENARGFVSQGGVLDLASNVVAVVQGEGNLAGIEVQGGSLGIGVGSPALDLTVQAQGPNLSDVNASGIHLSGALAQADIRNTTLSVDNTAGNQTLGVLIDGVNFVTAGSAINLLDTTMTIAGSQLAGTQTVGVALNGPSQVDPVRVNLDAVNLEVTGFQALGLSLDDTKSVVVLQNSLVDVQADVSARGLLTLGGDQDITIAETEIDVRGGDDAWAVVTGGGSLQITDQTTIAAHSTNASSNAIGLYGSNTQMVLDDAAIEARSGGSAIGLLADMDATLQLTDTVVLAHADAMTATAVHLNGVQDVLIQGNSLLRATGDHDVDEVRALHTEYGASAELKGAQLSATLLSADVDKAAIGALVESDSRVTLSEGTRITVDTMLGGDGYGVGVWKGLRADVTDSEIIVNSQHRGMGLTALDGASAYVTNTLIEVVGNEEALGLGSEFANELHSIDNTIKVSSSDGYAQGIGVFGADLKVVNNDIQVISDTAEAVGVAFVALAGQSGQLASSRVSAVGGTTTAAVVVSYQGDLTISDQTHLSSSGDGVMLHAATEDVSVSLSDTEVVAGGSSFVAAVQGAGNQRFVLGAGTLATANDGSLLSVRRQVGVPTGRVDFHLADGAVVAGTIHDDVMDAADLTPDGGTYVAVNNAEYSGQLHNVRGVSVTGGGRIQGGAAATPNTVLGDVVVDNAVLAGNWDIGGTLQAGNQGRVAPGNSIGVITAHSLNWGSGTIYEVEVNSAGASDRVDVTGPVAADISQTTLHVMQEDGTGGYRLDHDYTIMTAAGGIDGSFLSAQWQGSELITVKPVYQANQILMSLSVDDKALDLADLTANQRATAEAGLSVAGLNSAVDAAFLSSNPAAAFDLLSGEIHPSTRAGLMSSSTLVSNAILGRLRDRQARVPGAGGDTAGGTTDYPMWVSYTHNQQTTKGDDNTARRRHRIDGFSLGGDVQVGAGWQVGGAFSYSNSKVKLNQRRSSADIDSYGLALYAGKAWLQGAGAINLMAGLGYTWHDIGTQRSVVAGGAHTLKADVDARTTQLFGELGYTLPIGQRSQIEPYLGLTWLQHRTDGFTESGGPAALKGDSGTESVTFSTLGVRASTTLEAGKTLVTLRGGLGWRHAFGDRDPSTRMAFRQGGSNAFTVTGAPIARHSAVFEVGAEVQVGKQTVIGLGYEGQAGSRFTDHAGNLYLKTRF